MTRFKKKLKSRFDDLLGGKKKRKRKSKKDDDDDSSSSSDDEFNFDPKDMKRYNYKSSTVVTPIYSYYYDPYIYYYDTIDYYYTPTWVAPLSPYVYTDLYYVV